MKEIKFAENLRLLRKSKGMSQSELAKFLGVDQRTVSTWERGMCEPTYLMLSKIGEIFEQSFDDLLT